MSASSNLSAPATPHPSAPPRHHAPRHQVRRLVRWRLMLAFAYGATLLAILLSVDVQGLLAHLLIWFEQQGSAGYALFTLLFIATLVLLLPTTPFELGAGALFGLGLGTLLLYLGYTGGGLLAFVIARHLLPGPARHWLMHRRQFRMISGAIGHSGWRIAALSRIMPFFPMKLSNYAFGLTHMSGRQFMLGTLPATLLRSLINAYVGALAAELAGVRGGDGRSPQEWAILWLGFVAVVAGMIYLVQMGRRAVRAERAGASHSSS